MLAIYLNDMISRLKLLGCMETVPRLDEARNLHQNNLHVFLAEVDAKARTIRLVQDGAEFRMAS